MAKTNKITPKQGKSQYKRVVVFLTVATILVLSGFGLYAKFAKTANSASVDRVRQNVRSLTLEMKSLDDKSQWKDGSYCTVYDPRLFGEKKRYTCDVSHEIFYIDSSKEMLDETVNIYQSTLQKNKNINLSNEISPVYISESDNYTGRYRQIRSFNFALTNTEADRCSINYDLNAVDFGYTLQVKINCHLDTQKAYYEPIRYI